MNTNQPTDEHIIGLFFDGDEAAIPTLQAKYERLCFNIARRILPDERDAEECVSDAYIRIWKAIPPERPDSLIAYLSRIVRNLALERYSYNNAQKRSTSLTSAYEELEDFLPTAHDDVAARVDEKLFHEFLNGFLAEQSTEARVFFVRHYFYGEPIADIAASCKASVSKVKTSLFRTRGRLRTAMEKEGIFL